jgi:hypothetical protein
VLEYHPVGDPAAVAAPRMPGGELRRLAAATLIQQREELDPGGFQQA